MARTDKPSPILVAREIVEERREDVALIAEMDPFVAAGWRGWPDAAPGMVFLDLEDFRVSAYAWKSGFELSFDDEDHHFIRNIFLPSANARDAIKFVEAVRRTYESLR